MDKMITIGEKYGPAMVMTETAEADAYWEECVAHTMTFGKSREEAEQVERSNLGYYAGYYSAETRARVEHLFACAHPIFGAIAERGQPTAEEAFALGQQRGRASKEGSGSSAEASSPSATAPHGRGDL
jgi:hypothetical protein